MSNNSISSSAYSIGPISSDFVPFDQLKIKATASKGYVLSNEYLEKVKEAFKEGLFKPYEKALAKPQDSWQKETWSIRLKNVTEKKSEQSSTKNLEVEIDKDLLLCYLFTIAIDPQLEKEEKMSLIEEVQRPLQKQQLKSLHGAFIDEFSPPMSAHVLRYCNKEVWQNIHKIFLGYRVNERPFLYLIEAATETSWNKSEKQEFIDKIFENLSPVARDNLLYYFRLQPKEGFKKLFMQTCSKELNERMNFLKKEVIKFGLNSQRELNLEAKCIRLSFKDNQREYFLKWFFKKALNEKNSDLIAVDFEEKDWRWLQNKSYALDTPFMQWMINLANRLKQKTLVLSEDFNIKGSDTSRVWKFYQQAAKCISQKQKEKALLESYKDLSNALTAESLYNYMSAFRDLPLADKIIKNLFEDDPQKIVDWFSLLLAFEEEDWEKNEKMSDFFELIDKNELIVPFISLFFEQKESVPIPLLRLYKSLEKENQEIIFKFLLSKQEKEKEKLNSWMRASLKLEEELNLLIPEDFQNYRREFLKRMQAKLE